MKIKKILVIAFQFLLIIMSQVAFINSYNQYEHMPQYQKLVDRYLAAMPQQNFTCLISHPRSGNSFLRYVLEYVTKRPTLQINLWPQPLQRLNCPLGLTFNCLDTNLDRIPIWKTHFAQQLQKHSFYQAEKVYMILLIRNYRENLLRDAHFRNRAQELFDENGKLNILWAKKLMQPFIENIEVVHSHDVARTIVVYYEDLLHNPRLVIESLLAFLAEKNIYVDSFIEQFDFHKKNCLTVYNASQSQGKDDLYYSKKIGIEKCRQIDSWVKKEYGHIYDIYLSRYASAVDKDFCDQ